MGAGAHRRTPERLPAERRSLRTDDAGTTSGDLIDGRYRLERTLDGRGRVWLASSPTDGRRHAVKIGPRDSLRREFALLAALQHPNIVGARELVESGDEAFLVLEYLAGGDLVSLAGFAPRHWLRPLGDVVEALVALHGFGFVHRDLKARNVLLDESGRARLTDFGSAQPVGAHFTRGGTTSAAVAPDRGDGPVSVADDVHALACLLHELLFGAPPRSGRLKAAPRSAEALVWLVDACLETPDPAARPDLKCFRAVVKSSEIERDSE
jgi:eukaryotic-like serine/threonine-protein kinase